MNKTKELKNLGDRLRQIRENKGLTIEELETACGKPYQVLQRIETGKENPSMFLLYEIATGLGIGLDKLLKDI
jgi:putative transcriptional regulator